MHGCSCTKHSAHLAVSASRPPAPKEGPGFGYFQADVESIIWDVRSVILQPYCDTNKLGVLRAREQPSYPDHEPQGRPSTWNLAYKVSITEDFSRDSTRQ